jgi:hypothetical protein
VSSDKRVPAEEARKVAEQLIYHLAPVREHITIAGSLRRGKPDVGDIELVGMTSPALLPLLDKLVSEGVAEKAVYSDGRTRWGTNYRGLLFQGMKCEVFIADQWNVGVQLWLRTGPGDANTYIMKNCAWKRAPCRAKDGYWWHGETRLCIQSEQALFDLLGMKYLEPHERTEDAYMLQMEHINHRWGAVPHWCECYTARIDCADPAALDITVKSASTDEGRALSPTWELVNIAKAGRGDATTYKTLYLDLLRQRYKANPAPFLSILQRKRVVLTCYCNLERADTFCHRHMAVEVLGKIAAAKGIQFIQAGELVPEEKQMALF